MQLSQAKSKLKSSIAISHELQTVLFRKGQHFSNSIFCQRNKMEITTLEGEDHDLAMTRHFILNENNKLTRITKIFNKNQLATITDTIQVFERPRDSFVSPHKTFEECQQTPLEDPSIKNIISLFKNWLLESRIWQRAYLELQRILQQSGYNYELIQTIAKNEMLRDAFLDFETGGKRAIARAKLPNKRQHTKTLKNCVQLIKMQEIIMKPQGSIKITQRTEEVLFTFKGVENTLKSNKPNNNTQE